MSQYVRCDTEAMKLSERGKREKNICEEAGKRKGERERREKGGGGGRGRVRVCAIFIRNVSRVFLVLSSTKNAHSSRSVELAIGSL